MKIKKIIIAFLVMLVSVSILSPKVSALNNIDTNQDYYDENGNYFNTETGEYFIWDTNSRSTAKTFSFKIRYSISSESFRLNSSTVRIKVYRAVFQKTDGSSASCCNDHEFVIDLRREAIFDTHNRAYFYAPFTSTQTWNLGGGFYTNEAYYVEIINNYSLPSGVYLVGSGEVYCS